MGERDKYIAQDTSWFWMLGWFVVFQIFVGIAMLVHYERQGTAQLADALSKVTQQSLAVRFELMQARIEAVRGREEILNSQLSCVSVLTSGPSFDSKIVKASTGP